MENAKLPKNEILRHVVKEHFLDDVIEEYSFKKTFEDDANLRVIYQDGNFKLTIGESDSVTRMGWWNENQECLEYPQESLKEGKGFEAQIPVIVKFIEDCLAKIV